MDFSSAFAELMTEYYKESIYGDTDNDDETLYQYMLFQDFIFDAIIEIKDGDIKNKLFRYKDPRVIPDLIEKIKYCFDRYIKIKFPTDTKLNEYTKKRMTFCEFVSKCLDYIDDIL